MKQIVNRENEQQNSSGHLKIGDGHAKEPEQYIPNKKKSKRHACGGEGRLDDNPSPVGLS